LVCVPEANVVVAIAESERVVPDTDVAGSRRPLFLRMGLGPVSKVGQVVDLVGVGAQSA